MKIFASKVASVADIFTSKGQICVESVENQRMQSHEHREPLDLEAREDVRLLMLIAGAINPRLRRCIAAGADWFIRC